MEKALMKVTKEIRLGKFLIQEMISSLEVKTYRLVPTGYRLVTDWLPTGINERF